MKDYEKPSGLANAVELVVEMLDKLVKSTMGKHWKPFANYIGSIMFFIFIANTSGLFGLRAPTADYGTTLSLALITFVMIQYSAFKTRKFRMFTDLFQPIPVLFPVNVIGEFATPVSLSLRLFGNIMRGPLCFRCGTACFRSLRSWGFRHFCMYILTCFPVRSRLCLCHADHDIYRRQEECINRKKLSGAIKRTILFFRRIFL